MCQGASGGVEKFSVRGDGLTTITTAESGESAVVAHATDGAYSGDVIVSKATRASDSALYLFKVCARLRLFLVRVCVVLFSIC